MKVLGLSYDWDEIFLGVTRSILSSLVSIIIITIYYKTRKRKSWLLIPKSIKIWSLFWIFYLWCWSTFIFFTGYFPNFEWYRASYGIGFAGAIWGLFWLYWYGSKDSVEYCDKDGTPRCKYHEAFIAEVKSKIKDKEDVSKLTERTEVGSL